MERKIEPSVFKKYFRSGKNQANLMSRNEVTHSTPLSGGQMYPRELPEDLITILNRPFLASPVSFSISFFSSEFHSVLENDNSGLMFNELYIPSSLDMVGKIL
jgi:hypothetical protein